VLQSSVSYYSYKVSITGHLTHSIWWLAGILGGALLCAIHGATVENTLLKMVMLQTHSVRLHHNQKKLIQWLLLTVSGHRFSA
jgi:hypothetical protein